MKQFYCTSPIVEWLFKGGWLMIPLISLSIVALYALIERYIALTKQTAHSSKWLNTVYDLVLKGNLEEAIAACNARKTAIARVLESALQNALKHRNGTSKADTTVEQAMTTTWQSILPQLEKNTYLLSTIAAIAPMLGFLGTVLGMIKAFYSLSTTTTVVPQQLLAGGIYEAMITTAAGLIVGLIAEVALRYCITRINTTAKRIDQIAYHLVAILNLS